MPPDDASDPKSRLDGKVALVLGASRGIGRAAAMLLARRGAAVVLAGRSTGACGEAARAIAAGSGRAIALTVDVAEHGQVAHAVAEAEAQFGGLDILVNNAGVIEPIGRLAECEPQEWARSIAVNLVGAFNGIHAAMPALLRRGGTVVNVSSGAASLPREGWSAYCSGKAGLAMLTQALHLEYGERIAVFGFRPGLVDTEMQVRIRASGVNEISRVERSALAPPEHPAHAIGFLCTEAAHGLRGRELDLRDPEFRALVGLPAPVR